MLLSLPLLRLRMDEEAAGTAEAALGAAGSSSGRAAAAERAVRALLAKGKED